MLIKIDATLTLCTKIEAHDAFHAVSAIHNLITAYLLLMTIIPISDLGSPVGIDA